MSARRQFLLGVALGVALFAPFAALAQPVPHGSTSGGGSGTYLSTCAAVGCRLSLGNASRYLIDDGTYWTLNTGLNISGNVVANIYGSGESGFQNTRTGTVGDATNPTFAIGRIISGGIGKPVFRWMYSADGVTERQVLDIESSGTFAAILDATRRSVMEGYNAPNLVYPIFRIASSTSGAASALELGAGGSPVTIGGSGSASCSANVVTVTTDIAHGFEVGQTIDVEAGPNADDVHMPEGSTYVVLTVPTTTSFTASGTCTNGAVTVTRYVSADTDAFVKRNAQNGGLTFVSGMMDGASGATASTALYTFQPTNDVNNGDWLFTFNNSAGTRQFSCTEGNGCTFAATMFTGGDVRATSDNASDLGTAATRYRHAYFSGDVLHSRRTLSTCNATTEGTVASDVASGSTTTSKRTKLCYCTSDGAGSPAYAWQNLATATLGTTTTCGTE
jgi:hypothetical protein